MSYTKRPPQARALCAGLSAAARLSTAAPALASACPSPPVRLTFDTHQRGLSIAISDANIDPYRR